MAAKRLLVVCLALIGSGGFLAAQNTGGGGGGGTSTTIKSGTSLPSTCTPAANNIFLLTTPSPAVLYWCSATDTWTTPSGGSVSTGNLTEATSNVLTINGGTGAVVGTGTTLQVKQANTTTNGYLSSTDWNTFNGKQASGNYVTALTGDVSASGPGSAAATLSSVGSAGTCGDATHSCALTFDAKGRETARSNTSITFPTVFNQTIENSTTPLTQRQKLNFVGGTNVTITPSDNGTDTTTLTFDATAGGGGVSSFNTRTGAVVPDGDDYSTFYDALGAASAAVAAIPNADATHTGLLTSTNWSTFNGKQAAGNYITALTGDATASGPGSVALTLATVGSSGTCGDATHTCALTFDTKGRETARSNTAITFPTPFYQTFQHDGTAVTQRAKFNLAAGSNMTVTASDNGTDTTTFTLASTGGSGSPGGSDTAVQYNNSGAFGGDATNFFYNSTTHALTVTGGINSSSTSSGAITLNGSTSGSAAITVAAAAGTPTAIQLPTTTGAANSLLQSDGGTPQATSWQASTGTGNIVRAASPTMTGTTTVNNLTVSGTCTGCGTSTGFNSITTGTNTSATMTVGSGGSIATTGTGTVAATSVTGLSVTSGKTLTASNSITLAGTDGTTMTFPSTSATITRTVASGTIALNSSTVGSSITSGACGTTVTVSASGVASTDAITFTPNADITSLTGYAPSTSGGLSVYLWPTANNVNAKLCNPTASSVTISASGTGNAVTLNFRVTR